MKYKVGDKVKIIRNINLHNFLINSIVTIKAISEEYGDYNATNGSESWIVKEEEMEEIREDNNESI